MGAVSYPNPKVADFVMQRMVPVQVPADAEPLASTFNVTWTPTVLVLDYFGKEHLRSVGFLPPEELIPTLLLGMGKVDLETNDFPDAISHFDELLTQYPRSFVAPEALYLRGVSMYKSSHDAKPLKEAYEMLNRDYPGSEWAKRAQPYTLL